jgi:DNA-binding transcriptional MerR regulator
LFREGQMSEFLTIGELARRTGVTTSTLRYYDELGLVIPVRRVSGQRRYAVDAVDAVSVVRGLREVGFTLKEAKRLLAADARSSTAWRAIAARKSAELTHRIASAEAAQLALEHSLACPKDDPHHCPTFWTTVKGVLSGLELADAHSRAHASAVGSAAGLGDSGV